VVNVETALPPRPQGLADDIDLALLGRERGSRRHAEGRGAQQDAATIHAADQAARHG
jgi:hypothetical protein